MARRNPLIKILVALGALVGLGYLFMHSVRDTRATPYTVSQADLQNWTLALEPASGPASPALVLRPPPGIERGLLDQLFKRAMESFVGPTVLGIPLVLHGELAGMPAGRGTPEALMAAARSAGLDGRAMVPRCLGYRRASSQQQTRQIYFVLFDLPALAQFRQQSGLDPAALSPVLFVAASDPDSNSWLPMQANPDKDCVAPIVSG